MPNGKYFLLALTPLLYFWHYGISWFLYRSSNKKILDDIHKFGIELSFVGITLFAGALFDKNSQFRQYLVNSDTDTVIASVLGSILIFFAFEAASVFFYKKYEERKRMRSFKVFILLGVSYLMGIATIGFSLAMF